jgi:putative phage-type endonuclease
MDPQVQKLLQIPQTIQRSPEWFEQRNNAITASDIPTVLGENKYKSAWTLLMDKCNANPKPFVGNDATRWGTHYEDTAIEKYSELRNKEVLSFGLLIHPEYSWLGGSPDGITKDGILLEVKCPLKRKIVHGEIPEHYRSQILLNLEICNLEMGHFIEFVPGSSDNDYEINIVEIPRDREWFADKLSVMKDFWDSVVKHRAEGIETHPRWISYKKRIDTLQRNKKLKMELSDPEPEYIPIESASLFLEEY